MKPEMLQLLRMVRDVEDIDAPVAPGDVRHQAALYVEEALSRHLIRTKPGFVLTERGREALERAEALLAHKPGTTVLEGAALARPGEHAHADLQQMADHLAGVCQAQVNAMPHGRINFTIVVHGGDPSQVRAAPAWAYAQAGNMSRRDQMALLEEQLRVLKEQEALERAAAGQAPALPPKCPACGGEGQRPCAPHGRFRERCPHCKGSGEKR